MKKCKVFYLLSEKGRKKSLLSGGNGERVQSFEVELTEDIIKKARVDKSGNAILAFGVDQEIASEKDLKVKYDSDGVVVDVKIFNYNKPSINSSKGEGYEYTDSEGNKHRGKYNNEKEIVYFVKEGKLSYERKIIEFDDLMDLESLLAWDEERIKFVENKKIETNKILESLTENVKKRFEDMIYEMDKENEEKREDFIAEIEERIKERKLKESIEKEKKEFIEKYGSPRLKKAYKHNYKCQRLYVLERAEKEFPDYTLDFNGTAYFDEKVNPSLEALNVMEKLIDEGYNADIVWLKAEPTNHIVEYEDEYTDDDFEPREAVRIYLYLGRYDLYKYI